MRRSLSSTILGNNAAMAAISQRPFSSALVGTFMPAAHISHQHRRTLNTATTISMIPLLCRYQTRHTASATNTTTTKNAETATTAPSTTAASTTLTKDEKQEILKKSEEIQKSAKNEEEKEQKQQEEEKLKDQSAYQRLMGHLKGLSFKELVKQYGIPLAVFYWVTNESLVALLTYLFHYNYLTTGDVVDGLKYIGLDSFVNIENIHSTSITLMGVEISALFLTNFLVASAVMSLFTPIQVPLCIAVFPYLRGGVRKILGRKGAEVRGAAAATVVAATGTAAST